MANGSSRPLRMNCRPSHRNRFLAVCIGMVLAPRTGSSSSLSTPSMTPWSSIQSTPLCSQKRASSEAITARGRLGDIWSRLTQSLFRPLPVKSLRIITLETGGGTTA